MHDIMGTLSEWADNDLKCKYRPDMKNMPMCLAGKTNNLHNKKLNTRRSKIYFFTTVLV